jgi:hypothetical protein
LTGADGAHLEPDHIRQLLDQIRLERTREADRLWKAGCAARGEAGAALLVQDRGDAEPCARAEKALDLVGALGARAGCQQARSRQPRDVADAEGERFLRGGLGEPLAVEQRASPDPAELGELASPLPLGALLENGA